MTSGSDHVTPDGSPFEGKVDLKVHVNFLLVMLISYCKFSFRTFVFRCKTGLQKGIKVNPEL